jgi:raffinose/stachyose/melibiose transport system permease protein
VGDDLVDTLTGLVVFYSSGSIFCFFLVQGYLRTIPMEIVEAAGSTARARSRSSGASCSR